MLTCKDRLIDILTEKSLILSCIQHFCPGCLVPIFAVCNNHSAEFFLNFEERDFKPFWGRVDKPHLRDVAVTEEQAAIAIRFKSVLKKKSTSDQTYNLKL